LIVALHGGAGVLREDSPGRAACEALERALEAASAQRCALDAVVAAVVVLEDSPHFNAGRGSCLNAEGRIEMDASVMHGATRAAGAVAAVRRIRNPVLAARAVMERSGHVLLAGAGAEAFAREAGLRFEPPRYFITAKRRAALERNLVRHHGTVGAVALDADGNLAAATSTGGYTGKLAGRIGDSPIVGAGTYADNATCAVSGTGLGEVFIRAAVAYDIAARVAYLHQSLARAAQAALRSVARLGGDGGLVAVDRRGNITMPFNSEGMYRASLDRRGRRKIAIF
jgi:isoaspartyl peptidase/L-asparaginase-like protein (Ntn-hydrolase superfamily)